MYNYIRCICLFIIFVFTLTSVQARPINDVYGGIGEGQTIYYSFLSNKWSYQKPKHRENKILAVTREVDCEGYSEYASDNDQVYYPAGSNYEFLHNGRLITYHINELKLFEIIYNKKNKAFLELPLDVKEIKKIMGNPKIIYISNFNQENKIEVRKMPFLSQKYLILNDTDKYFYNYNLDAPHKDGTIKTLFKADKYCVLYYSHDTADEMEFPIYEIKIKF